MKFPKSSFIFIFSIIIFCALQSIYIIDQWRCGIVSQFGNPVRVDMEPGLHFKIPFVQDVITFDKRIQSIEFSSDGSTEIVASDQKTLILDAFTLYKIVDPLAFYKAVKNENALHSRIESIINSTIREVIGSTTFAYALAEGRTDVMKRIEYAVNQQMADYGVEITTVNITYFGLPEQAKEAVYSRMRLDRSKEAAEIRAEGSERAKGITATADRECAQIIASAQKKAAINKGVADAEAIRLLSIAYGKNPSFFKIYRSLDILRESITSDNSTIVVSTDNKLLNLFNKNPEELK